MKSSKSLAESIPGIDISQLQEIFSLIPLPIIVMGTEDGSILFANKRCTEFLGFDPAGADFMRHAEIFGAGGSGGQKGHEEFPVLSDIKAGLWVREAEMNVMKKDGLKIPVRISAAPLYDVNGKTAAAAIIAEDIAGRIKEEELRANQSLFKAIIENSRDGINLLDLQTNKYVYMSSEQIELTGFTAEEMNNFSAEDGFARIHPEDREISVNQQRKAVEGSGSAIEAEYRWKVKNGKYRWLKDTRLLLRDKKGGPSFLIGISRDITEEKKLEKERALLHRITDEQTGRLQAIIDSLPVGILIADASGMIVFINDVARNIYGGEAPYASSIEGYGIYKMWTADTGRPLAVKEMPLVRALMGETLKDMEYDFLRCDGTICPIAVGAAPIRDINGKIQGSVTIVQDTTKRKQEEAALHKSENLIKMIFDGLDDYIFLKGKDSRLIMANAVMSRDLGLPSEQLTGKNDLEILAEKELAEQIIKNDRKVMQNGEALEFDETMNLSDGLHIFHSKKAPWKDEEGNIIGLFGISRDITERQNVEETLKEYKKENKRNAFSLKEMMEADSNKNAFLATLSHELRNPLAAISASLQLLNISDDEKQIDMAKKIMGRQIRQLTDMVDDLLDVTRISHNKIALKQERLNLNDLALSRAEDYQKIFEEKEIKLTVNIIRRPVSVDADPARLRQLMGNLLSNALKYTDRGGRVTLKVSREQGEAAISVKDTGIGIEPEVLPKLFTPFFQTDQSLDRRGGGLGLGLSIAKGIAELHGGTIRAASRGIGKGTEFIVCLPLACGGEQDETAEKERPLKNAGTFKILLVEDNRDLSDLLATMLRTIGGDVYTAYDGLEGLEAALKIRPDVIFSDIGLPGLNGYELAGKIRGIEQLENTYMVAMTGYASAEDVGRAIKSGFDRHVSKPVELFTLMEILDNI